jgi:hypothetical protein
VPCRPTHVIGLIRDLARAILPREARAAGRACDRLMPAARASTDARPLAPPAPGRSRRDFFLAVLAEGRLPQRSHRDGIAHSDASTMTRRAAYARAWARSAWLSRRSQVLRFFDEWARAGSGPKLARNCSYRSRPSSSSFATRTGFGKGGARPTATLCLVASGRPVEGAFALMACTIPGLATIQGVL